MNLVHLIYVADDYCGSLRGTGAELRRRVCSTPIPPCSHEERPRRIRWLHSVACTRCTGG